jgi:hypothetical protein
MGSVALLGLCGCGLHLGEGAVQKREIRIGQEACMGHIDQVIYRYVHADLTSSETDEFFMCLQKSIKSFQTYVRGDIRDRYSPPELRQFFETNLVPDRKISNDLLRQLMILKATVAGGTPDSLTRAELNRTLEIVETVRQIALVMRPYIRALNPWIALRSAPGESMPPLDESIQALKNNADTLGHLMTGLQRPYAFSDIESLVQEWRRFSKSDPNNDFAAHQWIVLWKSFNEFTGGASLETILSDEWPKVLYQISGWYTLWVRFKYIVHEEDTFQKDSTDGIRAFLDEFVDLMDRILRAGNGDSLEYSKLDQVILDLEGMHLLPEGVRASSISRVSRILFSKMLGSPEINPRDRKFQSIELGAIHRLRSEATMWSNTQNMLLNTYFSRPSEHGNEARKWFRLSSVRDVVGESHDSINAFVRNLMPDIVSDESGVSDFLDLTKNLRPLFRQFRIEQMTAPRIYFVGDNQLTEEGLGYSYFDLSWINFLHTAVRFLFNGYAEDPQRRLDLSGVTRDEVQSFYTDLKPLGEDLQVIDPRKKTAGDRSFLEGKLFTYNSDGYDRNDVESNAHYLSFPQSVELISFLISGGLSGRRLYNILKQPGVCPPKKNGVLDIFGDPTLDTKCSMHRLVETMVDQFPNMPFWQKFFRRLSYDDKFEYLNVLVDSVKDPQSDANVLEKSDLVALSVVLQYVEAIFTRFDDNQDGILKGPELEKAYPFYKGMIEEVGTKRLCINMDSNKDRYAFMYILKFHQIPSTGFDALRTALYRSIFGWHIKMDRMGLAKSFRIIVQAILEADRKGHKDCENAPPPVPSQDPDWDKPQYHPSEMTR